jgi:hypothetical protein
VVVTDTSTVQQGDFRVVDSVERCPSGYLRHVLVMTYRRATWDTLATATRTYLDLGIEDLR